MAKQPMPNLIPEPGSACNGCANLSSVQGYFYTCNDRRCRHLAYYNFTPIKLDSTPERIGDLPTAGKADWEHLCWVPRTTKPKNVNPHNPLGEP